jgi:PAS domain S-box-containing protein
MLHFFRKLLSTDFMPHVYCLREPNLIKLHALSDAVIALAYGLIPLALLLLIRRRRDLAFPWMFSLFGIFILGCGLTHVMGVITLWTPTYRLDGLIKLITAAASIGTAVLLFRLLPQIQLLPSPTQLHAEIEQRQEAELELRQVNQQLEQRVKERTAALEQTNRRLSESEERFRTLAEAVPNLLWATDANGRTTFASLQYEKYTGMPARELEHEEGWLARVHPDDREQVKAVWSESLEKRQAYETEYRLQRFDGAYRWFVARGLPISVDGELCQWLGSSTDIDDLKRTERALRRSNEELRQFAYAAAHDLQEPLRDVSNSLGMLKRRYEEKLDAEAVQWIDASTTGARLMHYMVKDLLSYSRAVDEAVRVEEPVDVAKAIRLAIENLSSTMQTTGATVEIGPLPRLRMHETHLVQIFQNLISNSIKYRKPDVSPVVKISAVCKGSDWQFSITDNGIGFDP